MAHFKLETELSTVLKLDAPLTIGPTARWQRKAQETTNTSLNTTVPSQSPGKSKTPLKGTSVLNKSNSNGKTTTNYNKTPNKTPGTTKNLPTSAGKKKTPKTPGCVADRFIPNRAATQFDLGYFKLTQNGKENDSELSPSKKKYQRVMRENLAGKNISEAKIIHYTAEKAPSAPDAYMNNLRVVYSQTKTPGSTRKTNRHIPTVPERILDAPEIVDDYYLNLLDWSVNNHLALSLHSNVYIWNASTGEIQQLMELEGQSNYVASVSWIKEGTHLAVGSSTGEVQLWDVRSMNRVRVMSTHSTRVGSMSWNSHILSTGARSGKIHHHDVRVPEHHVGTLNGHTQEVCGLKWSPDGRYLASGGNDNVLNIWPVVLGQKYSQSEPLYSYTQHQAAVKALAWCPWQNSILASGGGTADRTIRFWNANTGLCMNTIDTQSQVCGILWSDYYKELISGHGYSKHQLIIWKYPAMARIAELTGHSARILNMAMSPDGSVVASAGADETLRLWHCFPVEKGKKVVSKAKSEIKSVFKQGIR